MARKAEPGISYYQMKVNHISNSKLKLLFNEFKADGYWIWSCLLGRIYEDKGYYFDVTDKDELELFATDVCKMKVSVVDEVIAGCVRRSLFDKGVFDMFGVLTSDRIQLNYLEATNERRRKGTKITLIEEYLSIPFNDYLDNSDDPHWKNVIITRKNIILPVNNSILPRKNPQNKIEESKVKESSRAKALVIAGDDGTARRELKKQYQELVKSLADKEVKEIWESVKSFITDKNPDWIEPYADLWNVFAPWYKLAKLVDLSDSRRKKFATRLSEPSFDFIRILEKIKSSPRLKGDNSQNWKCSFDWIIENDKNFLKILEGNYD